MNTRTETKSDIEVIDEARLEVISGGRKPYNGRRNVDGTDGPSDPTDPNAPTGG